MKPERAHIPDVLPILSLPDAVVLPFETVSLQTPPGAVRRLIDAAMNGRGMIGVVFAGGGAPRTIGVAATIERADEQIDGGLHLLVHGIERIRIDEPFPPAPAGFVHVTALPERQPDVQADHALAIAIRDLILRFDSALPTSQILRLQRSLDEQVSTPRDLAYVVAAKLQLIPDERYGLLAADPLSAKLVRLLDRLHYQRTMPELEHVTT